MILFRKSQICNKRGETMNANKVRAKMRENGMTQADVAKSIGISENSLSRKLNGKREFLLSEVVSLSKNLGIDNPGDIFLSN